MDFRKGRALKSNRMKAVSRRRHSGRMHPQPSSVAWLGSAPTQIGQMTMILALLIDAAQFQPHAVFLY